MIPKYAIWFHGYYSKYAYEAPSFAYSGKEVFTTSDLAEAKNMAEYLTSCAEDCKFTLVEIKEVEDERI